MAESGLLVIISQYIIHCFINLLTNIRSNKHEARNVTDCYRDHDGPQSSNVRSSSQLFVTVERRLLFECRCTDNAPSRSTNLMIILGMMQVSKKIPFEDPQVLMGVRAMYIISNLIIIGIYLFIQQKINKKKGGLQKLKLLMAERMLTRMHRSHHFEVC